MFVVTGRDTVVPLKYQTKVADAYRGEKHYVRLPDSEHNAVLEGPSVAEYQSGIGLVVGAGRREISGHLCARGK